MSFQKYNYLLLVFALAIFNFSCKPTAQSIVDKSIATHGGEKYNNLDAEFDFRNMHYKILNKDGIYEYTRIQTDSSKNVITDIVTNDSFIRKINNQVTELPDSMVVKYKNSVNSVAYFFLIPKPLNDAAVIKELIGVTTIKGKKYFKIKVKFKKDGGGKDHQDIFIYWINKESYTIDYLAYSYDVDDTGVRFREAFNVQTQNGIMYSDYRNYGYEDLKIPVEELDKKFEDKTMPLKSEIVNLNVIIK